MRWHEGLFFAFTVEVWGGGSARATTPGLCGNSGLYLPACWSVPYGTRSNKEEIIMSVENIERRRRIQRFLERNLERIFGGLDKIYFVFQSVLRLLVAICCFFWHLGRFLWYLVGAIIQPIFVLTLGYIFRYFPSAKLKSREIPNIPLNPHEQVVRQYQAAVLKAFKCHVYLTVTNQRLIISGYRLNIFGSVRCRIHQQVSIASVSGVFTGYTRITSWLRFCFCFFGLYLVRLTYVCWRGARVFNEYVPGFLANMKSNSKVLRFLLSHAGIIETGSQAWNSYFPKFGPWELLFLIVSYLLAQRWLFALQLHSAAASTPIALGDGYGRKSALEGLQGQPTAQTEAMVCELGQLIEDIRLNGDNAIARWSTKGKVEGNFQRALEKIDHWV